PDPFAQGFANAAPGMVIIAGSVDDNGAISSFSNRARGYQTHFLSALGESVQVTIGGDTWLISGTSFAAPQIAGAVALLAQAFPDLTPLEIVEILMVTAQDVGPAGPDNTYGMGIMDIHQAF